ncbi:uncharacterized protein M421DRAFT_289262 [Didymella exigua CBS 183.55]|uniref:Uncharacterized protein n=1 Tax=Didymella exigua CBS 183.55 TaxID=1150837 RepID=A0A6A5RXL7_9PLEO|nr:uncharacterized protein M421DRAFT_289262 [Didymella exigua CBS 183.55]KAF1932323.1 hypothetical protein M421DRAFT_289262 [Didymella exigua CBS 183.55]
MTTPNHERHAAVLHDCTRRISHPDSEEAVQIERQRVAQELEPFSYQKKSRATSYAARQPHDGPSRTRQTLHTSSTASNAPLRDRVSLESRVTTQSNATRSQSNSIRAIYWYSKVVRFWTTHVSLTIDDGAHRDHLGIDPASPFLRNTSW